MTRARAHLAAGVAMTAALAVAAAACGHREAPPPPAPPAPTLGGDVVATVGSVAIPRRLVADVARARGIPPREALDGLVDDALAAQGAHARGLDDTPEARRALTADRARWTADTIQREVTAKGLPDDKEVAELSRRHWRSVDVPEAVHAVHAVVLRGERNDAHAAQLGPQVAADIARAVRGATDADDFIARAKSVDARGLDVREEKLPPFTLDGRFTERPGTVDATFAQAAFRLAPGQTSGVVETRFGWHVIRDIDHVPPKVLPIDQRRAMFLEEALQMRGQAQLKALGARLEQQHPVRIEPTAEELMTQAAAVAIR